MTFREAMIENEQSGLIFGNAEHFAELGTYTPADGTAVVLSAVCTLVGQDPNYEDVLESDEEQLRVGVCKDPDCPRGGVVRPTHGDTYVRPGEEELPPWSFHRVDSETAGGWQVLFTRPRPRRYGSRR